MIEKSKLISSIGLYRELPVQFRLNVVPFVLLHILSLWFNWTYSSEYEVLSMLVIPVSVLLHILSFLFAFWSVDVDSLFNYKMVQSLSDATHVKVIPAGHKGTKAMCPVQVSEEGGKFFLYQKRKYLYDVSNNQFTKLQFPVNQNFEHYKSMINNASDRPDSWYRQSLVKFGKNEFDIPIPSFKELYIEQALAPFFVFQLFCVGLWFLDEYWHYSLFILVMLFSFEATVVKQRLQNLKSLRGMTTQPKDILVMRGKNWVKMSTSALVPGDICIISWDKSEPSLPADFLLLSGSCVVNESMLTGESTPLLKEPVTHRENKDVLSLKKDSIHILYAGTKIVQVSPDKKTPGCLGYVLKTGFDTSQGSLVRTILFSTQRVTANNLESFLFILFLLCFALVAAGYVLKKGLEDPDRSRYKLLLECTLIITSVVPPELPTELSLAVNTSLLRLQQLYIFCTEPFRIPYAGKVDVCCFDKTGTLTDSHLVLKGVAGLDEKDPAHLIDPADAYQYDVHSTLVMAGCHALTNLNKDLIGDPMEKATLEKVDWTLANGEYVRSNNASFRGYLSIVHRHHFSSALARMATIVNFEQNENKTHLVLVKGAPEVIEKLLTKAPSHYKETYLHYAHEGKRIIALAYKPLPGGREKIFSTSREDIESDLIFAGFLIFECPLKPDSLKGIEVLMKSSHKVVMITGDNPLTACQVAKELKMTTKSTLILDKVGVDKYSWNPIASFGHQNFNGEKFPFETNDVEKLVNQYDLCVYGDSLSMVLNDKNAGKILSQVKVIARSSPEHKTLVLAELKKCGYTTLMCGDGTNDVGALKQAHIGIALLNTPPPPPKEDRDKIIEKEVEEQLDVSGNSGPPKGTRAKAKRPQDDKKELMKKELEMKHKKLLEKLEAEELKMVQLGDASIASPFTAKSSSILSVAHIIRQGRCTLVTTRQMYRILALNCLIQAYGLSVLYLDGIRLGDSQATIAGMLLAMCFLFITKSAPLEELSAQRPMPNLFNPYMFISILGQFAVHCGSLIWVVTEASAHLKGPKPTPDSEFKPNLVNSAVFLIMTSMQVSTFAINYVGRPFTESLRENKWLMRCLTACGLLTIICALEISPTFNESFELVPLPSEFKYKFISVMIADALISFSLERFARKIFGGS
eukprot:TRINITY_DN2402_c0_g1_i1.p1 TRINITY_DN2402_c0_g1~~TRINITY_DN2402_c0_g1_i1.p1  ORF type:complete len:1145 (-),score=192.14 TRINITY_DN2402_c0_g1_i1:80-3514(-)